MIPWSIFSCKSVSPHRFYAIIFQMITTLALSLFAIAAQQDTRITNITPQGVEGKLTDAAPYIEFNGSGWQKDSSGNMRAYKYTGSASLDLGAFVPFGNSVSTGVTAAGEVSGWYEANVSGVILKRSFLYTFADEFITIPMTSSGIESWTEDVDTFGHFVVGTERDANGMLGAWDYSPTHGDLSAQALSTPAGWESEALAVSGNYVGGLLRDPNGVEHAAVWDWHRNVSLVPLSGQGNSRITGITDFYVCGWQEDSNGNVESFIASVASPHSDVVILPKLGNSDVKAEDRDNVIVVGSSTDEQGRPTPFRYTIATGVMEDMNESSLLNNSQRLTDVVALPFGGLIAMNGTSSGVTTGFLGTRTVLNPYLPVGSSGFFRLSGATDNSRVFFIAGMTTGLTAVPGSTGLFVNIASPRIVRQGITGVGGGCTEWIDVPGSLSGKTVYFQAVLPSESITTEVIKIDF